MTSLRLQLSASSLHIQLHLYLFPFNYLSKRRNQQVLRSELHLPFWDFSGITTSVRLHSNKGKRLEKIHQIAKI